MAATLRHQNIIKHPLALGAAALPEQRQARNNNGSKFTVLSVATQRSWKNTDDEWASNTEWHRVCVFRPRLAEYVATTIKKGSHL
jgi:single-stranded DNA-binding protein